MVSSMRKSFLILFLFSFIFEARSASADPWPTQGFFINPRYPDNHGPTYDVMFSAYPDAQSACNLWISTYLSVHSDPDAVPTLRPDQNSPYSNGYICDDGKNVFPDSAYSSASIGPDCFQPPNFPNIQKYSSASITGYMPQYASATTCTCKGIGDFPTPKPGSNYQRYFDTGVCVNTVHRYHEASYCPTVKSDHSVYPLSGNNRFDVALGVMFGRDYKLNYDTITQVPSEQAGISLSELASTSGFGDLWQDDFHKQVFLQGTTVVDPNTGYTKFAGSVIVKHGANTWLSFHADSSTNYVWRSDTDTDKVLFVALSSNGTPQGYSILDTKAVQVESYDGSGVLQRISRASGFDEVYIYSTAVGPNYPTLGLLMSVQQQDASGNMLRAISFNYLRTPVGDVRVSSVVNEAGTSLTFSYVGHNLKRISWPDGSGYEFAYDWPTQPAAVTAVLDVSSSTDPGTVFASYGYDSKGYAISSELSGGVDKFEVTYTKPPVLSVVQIWDAATGVDIFDHVWIPADGASMTAPNGSSSSYGAAVVNGIPRLTSSSHPAGSGCAASTRSLSYDTRGNILSIDDFSGNRTCYSYAGDKNRPLIELTGLPSSKACPASLSGYIPTPVDSAHPEKITSTNWDPFWFIKTKEASPLKFVAFVYNGNTDTYEGGRANCSSKIFPNFGTVPLVCKRYEFSTADSNGANGVGVAPTSSSRTSSYTYDSYGKVLTSTDALQHTTYYSYYDSSSFAGESGYTVGDLKSITNALGQTTNYTAYDKAGRLLSSTDPNSSITTQTYFPQGWLATQTVTATSGIALKTTYEYWSTGLLRAMTMPDGSSLKYTYDAAHRLTDILDSAGNKVHYELDNAGNRISEEVVDSSGTLASKVQRAFDALNRVQSSTGISR